MYKIVVGELWARYEIRIIGEKMGECYASDVRDEGLGARCRRVIGEVIHRIKIRGRGLGAWRGYRRCHFRLQIHARL